MIMGKLVNPNHVKTHWPLTPDEWANRLGIHKNTLLRWIKKEGLDAITDQRPYLVRGVDLKTFLQQRREKNRYKCGKGEMACLACRKPRKPAENLLDYIPQNRTSGMLKGLCAECLSLMNQAIRKDQIPIKFPNCEVTVTRLPGTLCGSTEHRVKVHLEPDCEGTINTIQNPQPNP